MTIARLDPAELPAEITGASERRRLARRLRQRRNAFLLIGLTLTLIALLFTLFAIQRSNDGVDHTLSVRSQVKDAMTAVIATEDGMRGWLLTGSEEYRRSYDRNHGRVLPLIDAVLADVRDNPAQHERVLRFRAGAEQRLARLAETLRVSQEVSYAAAIDRVRTGVGQRQTDGLTQIAAEIVAAESDLLQQRAQRSFLLNLLLTGLVAVLLVASPLLLWNGHRRIERDFAAEHAAEQALMEALAQNRWLLAEVNHRVKNSLQVVASLLTLQAMKADTPALRNALQQACGRVTAVARVHQRLHQAGERSLVDMRELLEEVAAGVHGAAGSVTVRAGVTALMTTDKAVLVALIVNELVTNAVKYAYPSQPAGGISVTLERETSDLVLEVADAGIGLPDGFDFTKPRGFGTRMIGSLVAQLGGRIDHEALHPGTRIRVRVPMVRDDLDADEAEIG